MNRQHAVNMSLCPSGLFSKDIILPAILCYFSNNSNELYATYLIFNFILLDAPIGDLKSKLFLLLDGAPHDQKNYPRHRLFKI